MGLLQLLLEGTLNSRCPCVAAPTQRSRIGHVGDDRAASGRPRASHGPGVLKCNILGLNVGREWYAVPTTPRGSQAAGVGPRLRSAVPVNAAGLARRADRWWRPRARVRRVCGPRRLHQGRSRNPRHAGGRCRGFSVLGGHHPCDGGVAEGGERTRHGDARWRGCRCLGAVPSPAGHRVNGVPVAIPAPVPAAQND